MSDQMEKLKSFQIQQSKASDSSNNASWPFKVINGKALSLPKPDYPLEARKARATGIIVINVTIDEKGKVIEASDMCGGNPYLVKAAEEAARSARFSPTFVEGQAVKVTGVVTYRFVQ